MSGQKSTQVRNFSDDGTELARVPVEPTEAMLDAARDWSLKKYGKAIGSDAARGCWDAMLRAGASGNR